MGKKGKDILGTSALVWLTVGNMVGSGIMVLTGAAVQKQDIQFGLHLLLQLCWDSWEAGHRFLQQEHLYWMEECFL